MERAREGGTAGVEEGRKRSGSVEVEALDFNFSTWHIHWAEVRVCVPDPKLAKIVVTPALDSTSA
jgi:hypothetical protein